MKVIHVRGPMPLFTNTYVLLDGQGSAAVVDPAADVERYLEILEKEKATLTHILLTHGHFDHVGAVRELKQKTKARVLMQAADADGSDLLPLVQEDIDHTPADGDIIRVGSVCVKVLCTPGHTKGSVCLLCDDVMFTGDTLFAGEIGRTDLPTSSYEQMQESLAKLCAVVEDEVQVLPGHDAFSDMGQEKAQNPYLRPFVKA